MHGSEGNGGFFCEVTLDRYAGAGYMDLHAEVRKVLAFEIKNGGAEEI